MAHASVTASRLPRTWLPAVLISFTFSVLCATALYYLLAQHDRSLVAQRNAAAVMAAGQSAQAMARTFAWFSESLISENLVMLQQAIAQHAQQAGLVDAAVITEDNAIVAAKNPAVIGNRLQDPEWLVARASRGGSIVRGHEQGWNTLIVVEPLRQQDHIVGWVRLVVATPLNAAVLRSPDDLARDVALAIVPLFMLMTTLLALTLRGIMSQVRSIIGRILLEARDQTQEPAGRAAELSEAG
jgi:hypothetical protein